MEKFTGSELIGRLNKGKKDFNKNLEGKSTKERKKYKMINTESTRCIDSAAESDSEWKSAEIFSGYFLRDFPFSNEHWTISAINFETLLIGYESWEMGIN